MSEIQASKRCIGSCPIGREGEVFFTTINSNQHIHPPYSSIWLWAEQVEQGRCTIETPLYYHERYKSPKRSTSQAKKPNLKIQSSQNTKWNSSFYFSQPPTHGCSQVQNSLPLSNTTNSSLEPCDASSPPTVDGDSIDNLPQYICWVQGRFPTYWTLLDEVEDKLCHAGFVFKSIIQEENMKIVIGSGVAVGIAAMFVDEVRGYKRFQILHSCHSDSMKSGSNSEDDLAEV